MPVHELDLTLLDTCFSTSAATEREGEVSKYFTLLSIKIRVGNSGGFAPCPFDNLHSKKAKLLRSGPKVAYLTTMMMIRRRLGTRNLGQVTQKSLTKLRKKKYAEKDTSRKGYFNSVHCVNLWPSVTWRERIEHMLLLLLPLLQPPLLLLYVLCLCRCGSLCLELNLVNKLPL